MTSKQYFVASAIAFILVVRPSALRADAVSDFRDCAMAPVTVPPPPDTCTLATSGTLYDEIVVSRPVTLQGLTSGSSTTTLTRGSSSLDTMIRVTGHVNVTIKDLTLDGNRSGTGIANYPGTTSNTVNNMPIATYAGGFHDIVIEYDDDGENCYECTHIDNVTLQNSPGYGLQISRSGVIVTNSMFKDGFMSGIILYRREPSSDKPVRYTEVYNSHFLRWGGSGLASNDLIPANLTEGSKINGNEFVQNHREFPYRTLCSGPCPGGQVYINIKSTFTTLYNNVFDGYYVDGSYLSISGLGTAGFEMYGRGHKLTSNWAFNHNREGLSLTSGKDVIVGESCCGNTFESNNYGVIVKNNSSPDCTDNVTLTNTLMQNNFLYGFQLYVASGTSAYHVTYTGNGNVYSGNNGGGSQYDPSSWPYTGSCP